MRIFLILTTKLSEYNDIFTSNIYFCQKCSNRGFAFLFHGGGLAQKSAAAAVNRGGVRLCTGDIYKIRKKSSDSRDGRGRPRPFSEKKNQFFA